MTDIEQMAKDIFYADPPSNPHGPNSDLVFDEPYTRWESKRARKIARALSESGYAFAGFEYQTVVVDIKTMQASELGKRQHTTEKDARAAAQGWVEFSHTHWGGTGELIMLIQRRPKTDGEWADIARIGDILSQVANESEEN